MKNLTNNKTFQSTLNSIFDSATLVSSGIDVKQANQITGLETLQDTLEFTQGNISLSDNNVSTGFKMRNMAYKSYTSDCCGTTVINEGNLAICLGCCQWCNVL